MADIEVVLFCPHSKLLTEPWDMVARKVLRPRSQRDFVSAVIEMAKCLGEINRFHSKKLPDKHLIILQKRMSELRKIVRAAERISKKQIIPWQHLEYLFSGEDRKRLKC